MKRVWAAGITASVLVVGGCGLRDYNERLDQTITTMKHLQALDQYLVPAAQGKFKEYNVYLRVPKPLAETGPAWQLPTGAFEHAASFQGAPEAPPVKEGATAPAALPPLKMHVLVRVKPKKATPKKGEAPPPEPAARGNFVADVRQLMANDYGPEAAEKSLAPVKKGETSFKTMKLTAANTGDDIRAYFAEADKGETEVALIFDIPPALRTLPIVSKGVEYALESFAVGKGARIQFSGGATAPGAKAPAPGPGF